jgi:hypothetical protein
MKKHVRTLLLAMLFIGISVSAHAVSYTGSDITLLGTEFSAISSFDTTNTPESGELTWYSTSTGAIWTAWGKLWVEYSVDLDAGNWNMGLNVTNHGNIGDNGWYSYFQITNSITNTVISIPASDDETNFGYVNLDIATAGNYSVVYTWINDKYNPNLGLDANIQIDNAFFDNTQTAPVPEPATMFLLGTGLVAFAGMKRKKK